MAIGRPHLTFSNVTCRFGDGSSVGPIDFELTDGDVVALAGPSGVGKTTLLNLAAGLISPETGRVENLFDRIGCVFQEPRLLPWYSARDNIALGLKAIGVARADRLSRAETIGLRMGLSRSDLGKLPSALSGGMAQRVSLARALIVSPRLLLLDEPFSALDIGLKQSLYNLLLDEIADRSLTVLFITHDLLEAVTLANTVVLMQKGPCRLLPPIAVDQPRQDRTQPWVFETAAKLMSHNEVARTFSPPSEER